MHQLDVVLEERKRNLSRPITGEISKDRIWEQWYDEDLFSKEIPQMSQKDFLFECIGNEPDRVVLNYRGKRTFTVSQYKEYIERFEKSFIALGYNVGDVICTIGLNTPELYAIKYSSTNQGLITCNLNILDLAINEGEHCRLYNELENVKPKVVFVLDILEDKLMSILNDSVFADVMKVIMPLDFVASTFDIEKNILRIKSLKDKFAGKKIKGTTRLKEFLKLGNKISQNEIKSKYAQNQPCNISFTSGTTGVNKAVLLSHDANNALAFQQINGKFGFIKGTNHLALIPPFLAFWDADVTHAAMCLGNKNIIELKLDYENIPKYFMKYKAEGGIWPQYLWNSLNSMSTEELNEVGKNLKFAIVGGERCDVKEAEKFYKKTGVVQMTGFGASEVNTTFSITHPNCNKVGTAGIPLPFNNVRIVDDNDKELTYGQRGKLYISSPCLMNGYYKRPDLTEKAINTDINGVRWYYTGDYAVMDEDGCLTVIDRYKPPVVFVENGKEIRVNMLDIVEDIRFNKNIKYCKMTFNNSKMIMHLSLEKDAESSKDDQLKNVIETIIEKVDAIKRPHLVCLYDDLPRTSVGKVDYKKIEQIGEEKSVKCSNERLVVEII